MDKKESREAERIWRIVKTEYEKYISYRDKIIKSGLIAILTLPFVFMFLMFFMPGKVVFLCLWIISFIAIAIMLTYVEYKGYYYKRLFGDSDKDINADEKGKEASL